MITRIIDIRCRYASHTDEVWLTTRPNLAAGASTLSLVFTDARTFLIFLFLAAASLFFSRQLLQSLNLEAMGTFNFLQREQNRSVSVDPVGTESLEPVVGAFKDIVNPCSSVRWGVLKVAVTVDDEACWRNICMSANHVLHNWRVS